MCVTGENIISAPDRSNDNGSSSVRFDHGLRFGRRVLRSSPTEGGGVLKYAPDRYEPCPHIWISMSHLVAKLPKQRTLSVSVSRVLGGRGRHWIWPRQAACQTPTNPAKIGGRPVGGVDTGMPYRASTYRFSVAFTPSAYSSRSTVASCSTKGVARGSSVPNPSGHPSSRGRGSVRAFRASVRNCSAIGSTSGRGSPFSPSPCR